ncbi:ABC transporter, ATP-binding protein (cluster 15, trp?) [Olavius algarvensis associated proteobacterium Delta 3]|nr:ABC transporter, ATP-binding protein (cluster 15, trp?) [Olavius algarvensis associated proteobacterium Delta 3]
MIAIEHLVKYFNRRGVNEVIALSGIDLTIERGEFITVIGSNGAGKSTLLNCLAGTFRHDEGRIVINGKDISPWPEYRRARFIGRVFQNPLTGTCASLTIEQNMALAFRRGARRGLSFGVKAAYRREFMERLAMLGLGLEHRLKNAVGLLSGGQRQALTMLMASLVQPELLLLDEHTAALDPKTARKILDLTRCIVSEEHLTTLMVTHNMKQALAFGSRLLMLHNGRVILDVKEDEKRSLTKDDLLSRFYDMQGEEVESDRMLLT